MNIVLLNEGAVIPKRADSGAAGYDLYAPFDTAVRPGRNCIPLGIKIELPPGYEGQIRPRSGFSLKGMEGFRPTGLINPERFNADVLLGTIDDSYRGEVGVIIKSYETQPFIVKKGTRIAQLVIAPYAVVEMVPVGELSDTERGEGKYGHSGTH